MRADVLRQETGEPLGDIDRAAAVVLGRTADELACVEFVELPFDAYGVVPYELRFQAGDFATAHPCVLHEGAGDELVIPSKQQRGPLSQEQAP